jgi:hypothetical protein
MRSRDALPQTCGASNGSTAQQQQLQQQASAASQRDSWQAAAVEGPWFAGGALQSGNAQMRSANKAEVRFSRWMCQRLYHCVFYAQMRLRG